MTESNIQQNIISYLSMIAVQKGIVFFSVPNESLVMVLTIFKVPKKICYQIVSFFKKMGLLPGVSDIVIIWKGKAYFMEVKTDSGTQSQDQVRFEHNVNKAGCEYTVVRSVGDVIGVLGEWGVL